MHTEHTETLTKLEKQISTVRGVIAFLGKTDIDEKDKNLVYAPCAGDLQNVTEHLIDMLDDAVQWVDDLAKENKAA